MLQEILAGIGQFSDMDAALFEKFTSLRSVSRNDVLLKEGAVCKAAFYILSGSFFQYRDAETTEHIIDLHLPGEWMFNQESLISQLPSATAIKAFAKSEVLEISLFSLHQLIGKSPAFLQFGKIFNQPANRIYLFDNTLSPAQKYRYILEAKPQIAQVFPVKMIAGYLKMAPETLSRVRADF